MNPQQREFILQNRKKMSSRQIAKSLGISRSDVEGFLKERTIEPAPAPPGGRSAAVLPWFWIFFFGGIVLRAIYVFSLRSTPFFAPLSNKLDDGVYDSMAQAISQGNWLADLPFSAYRIPLYPYFLGVIYKFFGRDLLAVHVLQSLIGAFTPLLVYGVLDLAFQKKRTALIGAGIAAFYIPFVFYENLLLGETLSIFLNLLGVWLVLRSLDDAPQRTPLVTLFLAGVVLGASALVRPNVIVGLVFTVAFIFYVFFKARKSAGTALSAALVFIFAIALALAPNVWRNYRLHKDFVPLSAVGGINLYIGNNPEADGKFRLVKGIGTSLDEMLANSEAIASEKIGRSLKPSEASSYWSREALHYAVSSPGDFIRLIARKKFYFLNHYEFPDILNLYFTARFISILSLGFYQYGLVVVLGLYGLVAAWKRRNAAYFFLGGFLAAYAASVVLFFITARYRLPAVPFFIAFAAVGADEIWSARERRDGKALMKAAAVIMLASFLVFRPVEKVNFATNYNSLAIAMKNRGDARQAEEYYKKAIETDPGYPSPYYNLALLLHEQGRDDEAAAFQQKYQEATAVLG